MGLFSRIKVWADGFVLPGSELNTEFDAVKDAVNQIEDINVKAGADIDGAKLKDETVTSAKIKNDEIVNADINSAAAIAASKLNVGWHNSPTTIKIFPSNFVCVDDDSPTKMVSYGGRSTTAAAVSLIANVTIPIGYKATAVRVHAGATKTVTVYECQIDDNSETSKGSGDTDAEVDITDVTADGTNYLSIVVASVTGQSIHGGYVTIEKT